jgi:hypothetical protein
MAQRGYRPATTLRPDPAEPDLLATVAAAESGRPERWQDVLYQGVYRRHTNRGRYRPVPVPGALSAKLIAAAAAEGARLAEIGTRRQRQVLATHHVAGSRREHVTRPHSLTRRPALRPPRRCPRPAAEAVDYSTASMMRIDRGGGRRLQPPGLGRAGVRVSAGDKSRWARAPELTLFQLLVEPAE